MRAAIIDDKLNIKDLTYVTTGTGNYWDLGIYPLLSYMSLLISQRQFHILYNLLEDLNIAEFRQYMCKNMLHNPLSNHYYLGCESGISL